MRRAGMVMTLCVVAFPMAATAAETASQEIGKVAQPTVERGKYISQIGGCNDCHTAGYAEQAGKVPVSDWLGGSPLGYKGPWGTTYAKNLRIVAAGMTEDQWVNHLDTFKTRPPMPWYDVQLMPDDDKRALYRFIKSLGPAGSAAPDALPPSQSPKTPYIVMAPPTMPDAN